MHNRMLLAAAVAAAAMAGAASATELEFSYFGFASPFFGVANWEQSSSGTPLAYDVGSDTTVAANGSNAVFVIGYPFPIFGGSIDSVEFYSATSGGGFDATGPDGNAFQDAGLQIYSGPESAPVFTPGVYDLEYGTLTISDVPEPATWTMMILGVGGVGAAMRRRKAQTLAA